MFFSVLPDYEAAKQIASLINVHNGLSLKRRSVDIVESRVNYVVETHGKFVIGAIGIERVSFTFSEVKHLVVRPEWRHRGVGRFITRRALQLIENPLVYCTVRENNKASILLFESLGFVRTEQYGTEDHDVVLLTRRSPRWEKKCSKATWKSGSSHGTKSMPLALMPSSWDVNPPNPLEDYLPDI